MAVYTEVSDEELTAFVARYNIGAVLSAKGIAEGVENSNYMLTTEAGNFILTLYEKRVDPSDLPFFIGLMEHLAAKGILCPTPVAARDGGALQELCGRPAAIVSFLAGMWPRRIHAKHCVELGRCLAGLHLAGLDFDGRRPNALGMPSWRPMLTQCAPRGDEIQTGLIAEVEAGLAHLEAAWPTGETTLPVGIIHADLFPDNVFFRDETLSGFIDFYFACTDYLAYDVAVCLNAWCFEPDNSFNATKARRMLDAYNAVRPMRPEEVRILPLFARGSALRFLLTRLYDLLNHPEGAFVKPKDPIEYLRRLRFHSGVTGPGEYGLVA